MVTFHVADIPYPKGPKEKTEIILNNWIHQVKNKQVTKCDQIWPGGYGLIMKIYPPFLIGQWVTSPGHFRFIFGHQDLRPRWIHAAKTPVELTN